MRPVCLAVLVGVVLGVGSARGEIKWLGGEGPPFAFAAGATGGLHPGDTLRLVVVAGVRQFTGTPQFDFHLTVPAELTLLAGDSALSLPIKEGEGRWTLLLRPTKPGAFDIRGRIHIDAGVRRDEAEFVMPLTVGQDTVIVEESHYTRRESVRNGQRYRYGDWWLIPIDSTEVSIVEADLEKRGEKSRVLQQEAAMCQECPVESLPDTVNFVVVVDKHGKLRDVRRMGSARAGGREQDKRIVAAAERVLKHWRFEAARGRGQAVSDWLYVRVPVLPTR